MREYRYTLAQVELKNTMWVARGLENLKEAARLEPRRAQYVRDAAVALHERGRSAEAEPVRAERARPRSRRPDNQQLLDDVLLATGSAAAPPVMTAPASDAAAGRCDCPPTRR